jgi:hypothetical protein
MDQTLRHALGIMGQLTYGHTAEVCEAPRGALSRPTLHPRTLTLKLHQAQQIDAEKGICVMEERNLLLLGLQPGDFVDIRYARPSPEGPVLVGRVTLRAFPASTARGEATPENPHSYPQQDRIYLDSDCRHALGIHSQASVYLDSPLLVSASVIKSIQARAVIYGLTILLGITTITQVLQMFFSSLSPAITGALALLIATTLTAGIAVIDVRSKVHV